MGRIVDLIRVKYKKYNKNIYISKKIDNYLLDLSKSKLDKKIAKDYKFLMSEHDASYMTPLNQLELICMLAKMVDAKKILEIGAFKGFCSLFLSKKLNRSVRITTTEINQKNIEFAKNLWERHKIKNIKLYEGDATLTLRNIKDKFDVIYIDADKNNYPIYFKIALRLSNKGTIILFDNSLWAGIVVNDKTKYSHASILNKLNREIYKSSLVDTVLVPAWDGLTILRVK